MIDISHYPKYTPNVLECQIRYFRSFKINKLYLNVYLIVPDKYKSYRLFIEVIQSKLLIYHLFCAESSKMLGGYLRLSTIIEFNKTKRHAM